MRKILSLAAAVSLSACSTGIGKLPGVNAPGQSGRALNTAATTGQATSYASGSASNMAGLEGIIGAPAEGLTQRFGDARIDLQEGDARKLQFRGTNCVLDIYLYPRAAGAQPLATHVEARSRSDGAPVDRARCIDEVAGQR